MTCCSRSLAYGRSAGKPPLPGLPSRAGRADARLCVLKGGRFPSPAVTPPANHGLLVLVLMPRYNPPFFTDGPGMYTRLANAGNQER